MKKLVILSLSLGSSLLALTSCGKVGNDRGQGDSSSSTTTSPSGDVSPTDPAITQLNQEITLLQTQVTNLNTQITTMTNNTDPALAAEIAELKKEYTTINTELTVLLALQSQATKNATDITNLTAQYNSLNILVQNLMNEVTPSNLNPAQKTIRQNYLNGNVMFPIEIVGLVNKKSFDQLIKISMYNTTNNIAGDISFSANTFFNLPNTITQDMSFNKNNDDTPKSTYTLSLNYFGSDYCGCSYNSDTIIATFTTQIKPITLISASKDDISVALKGLYKDGNSISLETLKLTTPDPFNIVDTISATGKDSNICLSTLGVLTDTNCN